MTRTEETGAAYHRHLDGTVCQTQACNFPAGGSVARPVALLDAEVFDRLADALQDTLWRLTPYGQTADGDVARYLVTKGTIHRLVAAAQSAATGAALRNTWVPEPDDQAALAAQEGERGGAEVAHPNRDGDTTIRPWRDGDGDLRCQSCGRPNVIWYADNETWNLVMPDDGVLCIPCFIARAEPMLAGSGLVAWGLFSDAAPFRTEFRRGMEAGRAMALAKHDAEVLRAAAREYDETEAGPGDHAASWLRERAGRIEGGQS